VSEREGAGVLVVAAGGWWRAGVVLSDWGVRFLVESLDSATTRCRKYVR
jgi:hypothetical protein